MRELKKKKPGYEPVKRYSTSLFPFSSQQKQKENLRHFTAIDRRRGKQETSFRIHGDESYFPNAGEKKTSCWNSGGSGGGGDDALLSQPSIEDFPGSSAVGGGRAWVKSSPINRRRQRRRAGIRVRSLGIGLSGFAKVSPQWTMQTPVTWTRTSPEPVTTSNRQQLI